jgi:hypothetical protein
VPDHKSIIWLKKKNVSNSHGALQNKKLVIKEVSKKRARTTIEKYVLSKQKARNTTETLS